MSSSTSCPPQVSESAALDAARLELLEVQRQKADAELQRDKLYEELDRAKQKATREEERASGLARDVAELATRHGEEGRKEGTRPFRRSFGRGVCFSSGKEGVQ